VTPSPDQLELVLYPDPVLRTKTEAVTDFGEELLAIAEKMIKIMRSEDGIGLAAPQAGLAMRVFVCDVPGHSEDPAEMDGVAFWTDGPLVCVNPEFTQYSDAKSQLEEGCLSLPDIRGDVIRPEIVKMKAQDLDGNSFTLVAGGLLAKCLQHEFDHLEGVLIIDKMSQMSRLKNRTKLRKLKAHQGG
jgi:peptide deformylase